MVNIVSPNILEQVELAKTGLEEDPRYDLVKNQRLLSFFKSNAAKHSVNLELNGVKKRKNGGGKKVALGNLSLAESYLARHCGESLSEDQIKIAAALINNVESGRLEYRTYTARTQGRTGPLVYPINVRQEMGEFIFNNNSLKNSVEKAVHSHFHIARIHPFDDGNGRLARTLQNAILDCEGYPPILIGKFERGQYLDLLEAAERSYRDNSGSLQAEEAKFYNYLALRLRDSLVGMKDSLGG